MIIFQPTSIFFFFSSLRIKRIPRSDHGSAQINIPIRAIARAVVGIHRRFRKLVSVAWKSSSLVYRILRSSQAFRGVWKPIRSVFRSIKTNRYFAQSGCLETRPSPCHEVAASVATPPRHLLTLPSELLAIYLLCFWIIPGVSAKQRLTAAQFDEVVNGSRSNDKIRCFESRSVHSRFHVIRARFVWTRINKRKEKEKEN